jgi:hypothetical protein
MLWHMGIYVQQACDEVYIHAQDGFNQGRTVIAWSLTTITMTSQFFRYCL